MADPFASFLAARRGVAAPPEPDESGDTGIASIDDLRGTVFDDSDPIAQWRKTDFSTPPENFARKAMRWANTPIEAIRKPLAAWGEGQVESATHEANPALRALKAYPGAVAETVGEMASPVGAASFVAGPLGVGARSLISGEQLGSGIPELYTGIKEGDRSKIARGAGQTALGAFGVFGDVSRAVGGGAAEAPAPNRFEDGYWTNPHEGFEAAGRAKRVNGGTLMRQGNTFEPPPDGSVNVSEPNLEASRKLLGPGADDPGVFEGTPPPPGFGGPGEPPQLPPGRPTDFYAGRGGVVGGDQTIDPGYAAGWVPPKGLLGTATFGWNDFPAIRPDEFLEGANLQKGAPLAEINPALYGEADQPGAAQGGFNELTRELFGGSNNAVQSAPVQDAIDRAPEGTPGADQNRAVFGAPGRERLAGEEQGLNRLDELQRALSGEDEPATIGNGTPGGAQPVDTARTFGAAGRERLSGEQRGIDSLDELQRYMSGTDEPATIGNGGFRQEAVSQAAPGNAPAGEIAPGGNRELDPAEEGGLVANGSGERRIAGRRGQKSPSPEQSFIDDLVSKALEDGYQGNEQDLRSALDDRVQMMKEIDSGYEASGRKPENLLRAIANYGGLSDKAEKTYPGELRWLKDFQDNVGGTRERPRYQFGTMRGIKNVFNRNRGLSLDGMLEALRQDPQFSHIETINDLVDEIRAAGTAPDESGIENLLGRAGVKYGGNWWQELGGDAEFDPASLDLEKNRDLAQNPRSGNMWVNVGENAAVPSEYSWDALEPPMSAEEQAKVSRGIQGQGESQPAGDRVGELEQALGGKPDRFNELPEEIRDTRNYGDVVRWADEQARMLGASREAILDDFGLPKTEQAFKDWIFPARPSTSPRDAVADALMGPNGAAIFQELTGKTVEEMSGRLSPNQVALSLKRNKNGKFHGRADEIGARLLQEQAPVDTLDTGEQQPRLPGAADARQVGKADTSFRAPVQASGDDFSLETLLSDDARAREDAAARPSLFGDEPSTEPSTETPAPRNGDIEGNQLGGGPTNELDQLLNGPESAAPGDDLAKLERALYRVEPQGVEGPVDPNSLTGRWFSDNPDAIAGKRYGGEGERALKAVNVPEADLEAARQAATEAGASPKDQFGKFLLPREIADKAEQIGTLPSRQKPVENNVRDYLKKQLGYTDDEITAMQPNEARRLGREQVAHPEREARRAPKPDAPAAPLPERGSLPGMRNYDEVRTARGIQRRERLQRTAVPNEQNVTLYRGEAVPSGKQIPDWVREGLKASGALDAEGRWFTDDPAIAQWYRDEAGPGGRITSVSVPKSVATRAHVAGNPNLERFSRDPSKEFFLNPEDAAKAAPRKTPADRAAAGETLTTGERRSLNLPEQTRERTPTSSREQGNSPRQITQRVQKLDRWMADPTPENFRRWVDEVSGQAERVNERQLRGGTGEEGAPPKSDSGEYLAGSPFPGFQILADPKSRRALWNFLTTDESGARLLRAVIGGGIGAFTDDDNRLRGALIGAIGASLGPQIARVVANDFVALVKGKIPKGLPSVYNKRPPGDIGVIENLIGSKARTIPEQFNTIRKGVDELQEVRRTGKVDSRKLMLRGVDEGAAAIKNGKMQVRQADYLGPEIDYLRQQANDMKATKPRMASYLNAYADELAGAMTHSEQVAKEAGIPVKTVARIATEVGNQIYRLGLAFNVGSAAVNRLSQPLLTAPYTGLSKLWKNYAWLDESEKGLSKIERPIDIEDTPRAALSVLQKFDDMSSSIMRWSDNQNRQGAFAAAHLAAEQSGAPEDVAAAFARDVSEKTQGLLGLLSGNPRWRGPIIKMAKPFTKYPILFAEWLNDVATSPDPRVRWRTAAMAAGVMAFSQATGIDMWDLLSGGARYGGSALLRGAMDISNHVTNQARDHQIFAMPGKGFLDSDAGSMVYPVGVRKGVDTAKRFYRQGLDTHTTRTPSGAREDVTPTEDLLNFFGIRTTRQTERRKMLDDAHSMEARQSNDEAQTSAQAKRDFYAAVDAEDADAMREALSRLSPAARKNVVKTQNRDRFQRLLHTTPKSRRPELLDRYGELERELSLGK